MRLTIKGSERFHIPMDMPDVSYWMKVMRSYASQGTMPPAVGGTLPAKAYLHNLHTLGRSGVSTCFAKVQHARWGELGLKFGIGVHSIDPELLLERQSDGFDVDLAPKVYGMADVVFWYPDGYRLATPGMLTAIAERYEGYTEHQHDRCNERSTFALEYETRSRQVHAYDAQGMRRQGPRYPEYTREWYAHRTYRRTFVEDEDICSDRIWEGDDEYNEFYDQMDANFGYSGVADLHTNNCGYWDDHLVCIDWGWEGG